MKTRSGIGRLVLVATLIVFLLSACSTPTQSPPASSDQATTKPYGSLTVGWSVRIARVDPPSTTVLYPGYAAAVFDSLIRFTSDGKVGPGIAERWEISPDGLTHTFYIRKGIKFHDGSDLMGADVKYSLDRIVQPEVLKDSEYAGQSTLVAWRNLGPPTVDLKDDYTVVVRLKSPEFGLVKPMVDFSGLDAVVPKKYIEEKGLDYFRQHPVGSGAWKVVNFMAGDRIELEANENYWGEVPKFKNLTIRSVPEEATKVAMLKTGELDMADVSPDSAAGLKTAGVRVVGWDGGQQAVYAPLFDNTNPASSYFGDVRVRKAMSLAINRKEIADKLFAGYAEPGILNRVQRTADYFDANQLKADPYDPEGAKKLLAEAGYPNGLTTKFWDPGAGGILSTFIQAITGYWLKVGINAPIEPIESANLVPALSARADKIFNTVYAYGIGALLSAGAGPALFDLVSSFHSTKGFMKNHTNKKLDELIDAYPKTADPAERKKIAVEATVLAKNEFSVVSVEIVQSTWALGPKIGDFKPILGWAGNATAYGSVTHAK